MLSEMSKLSTQQEKMGQLSRFSAWLRNLRMEER